MKVYRTQEIARLVKIHPNTVRLYEKWHYISPVPRERNGYRQYNQLHLLQLQIARLAFRQELIQNDLRRRATKIVRLSGSECFEEAYREARFYLQHLMQEHRMTQQAIKMANQLLRKDGDYHKTYTHKEVARMLELTEETLRNWERNGLYETSRDSRNRRVYTEDDYYKLLVIRTLRLAHFSIASIRRLFEEQARSHQVDVQEILNSPKFTEDFLHVTDQLELNLRRAMKDVKKIIALLSKANLKED